MINLDTEFNIDDIWWNPNRLQRQHDFYSTHPRTFQTFFSDFWEACTNGVQPFNRPFDEIDNNFNLFKFPNECLGNENLNFTEYQELIEEQWRVMRLSKWQYPRYNDTLFDPEIIDYINARLIDLWTIYTSPDARDDEVLTGVRIVANRFNQNWDHIYIQQYNKVQEDIIMEAVNNEYKLARLAFQNEVELTTLEQLWANGFGTIIDVTMHVFYDIGHFMYAFMGMFFFRIVLNLMSLILA